MAVVARITAMTIAAMLGPRHRHDAHRSGRFKVHQQACSATPQLRRSLACATIVRVHRHRVQARRRESVEYFLS